MQPDATYAPPARGRRRWPWVLLVVVVVLLGLAVAADRIALSLAEDEAGAALQSSQHLSSKPEVSVSGFPFLTQLAAGRFDEITVSAHDVSSGSADNLTLENVVVQLHDVTVSDSYSTVSARTATADGRVSYAELSRVLGVTVTSSGNARLVAQQKVTVLGREYTAKISATVRATSDDGIRFLDPRVSAAGVSLPSAVAGSLAAVFAKPISLAGLPFGVRVSAATVGSSGLDLVLTGSNLSYSR